MALARLNMLRAASTMTRLAAASRLPSMMPTATMARAFSKAGPPEIVRGKGVAKKEEAMDLVSVLSRELSYEREEGNSAATLKEIAAELSDFTIKGKPMAQCATLQQ